MRYIAGYFVFILVLIAQNGFLSWAAFIFFYVPIFLLSCFIYWNKLDTDREDLRERKASIKRQLGKIVKGISNSENKIKLEEKEIESMKRKIDASEIRQNTLTTEILRQKKVIKKEIGLLKELSLKYSFIDRIIGKDGSVIRAKWDKTTETIASVDGISGKETMRRIKPITADVEADVEVGKIYEGKVAKIQDFGAFVTIMPGTDGLVHISEISEERVEKVTDHLTEGDEIQVKVLEVDRQGKIRLTMKGLEE